MTKPYSQARALWAITRASFKAIFNHPTAIVFSLLFPIIFILIFGAFGKGGVPTYRVTMDPQSDTSSLFYSAIKMHPQLRIVYYRDSIERNNDLQKGRLSAVLKITRSDGDTLQTPRYHLAMYSTTANNNTIPGVQHALEYVRVNYELKRLQGKENQPAASIVIDQPRIEEVRPYRQIDFILPGQLGFSILFSTLFGISFTFFGLREQLVLKRFYASPVNRINILLGIGMSRLFFQLMNIIVLVGFGYFFLHFTLQHGFITFVEILVMSVIMLFLLMGVGLIFSSVAKTDNSIPLLINLFGFPQMMLSGTFFPIEVFPKWLQEICNILPLTQFNNAIRKISFEGQHLTDCWKEIGLLAAWMVLIYIILVRVIKWE
jgi:ABC-2 type transport system permease protein